MWEKGKKIMRKIVSLFLTVVMLLSLVTMPAMAETEDAVVMLDMNFEQDKEGNYLKTLTQSTTTTNKAYTTSDHANVRISDVSDASKGESRGYIGVVNVSTDATLKTNTKLNDGSHKKVFKYYHQTAEASPNNYLGLKLTPNRGANTKVNDHTVVVEYDLYFEKHRGQITLPAIADSASQGDYVSKYGTDFGWYFTDAQGQFRYAMGGGYKADGSTFEYKDKWAYGTDLHEKWHKIKFVVDMSAKTEPVYDTYRMYLDGTPVELTFDGTDVPVYDFIDNRQFDWAKNFTEYFTGIVIGGINGATTGSIYFDNLKVTKYDGKFEVKNTAVEGADFIVTFNRNIDAATVKNAYVTDAAGNKVTGATISASGKTLTVSGLAGNTSYKLVLPTTFTDELGQGLVTYYVNNTTDAAYANYKTSDTVLDFTTGEAIVNNAPVTIYEENFDNWNNDNLLSTATEWSGFTNNAGKYYKANAAKTGQTEIPVRIFNNSSNGYTIGSGGTADFNKNVVKAVNAQTEGIGDASRGNVLKYTHTGSSFLQVALDHKTTANETLKGKTAIIEYDIYLPSTYNSNDVGLPSVLKGLHFNENTQTDTSWYITSNGRAYATSGHTNAANANNPNNAYWYQIANSKVLNNANWHTIKLVVTDKGDNVSANNPDSWRV